VTWTIVYRMFLWPFWVVKLCGIFTVHYYIKDLKTLKETFNLKPRT